MEMLNRNLQQVIRINFCSVKNSQHFINQTSDIVVTCSCGWKGENINARTDDATKYIIQGSGTTVGSCALECDTAAWEVKVGANPQGIRIGVKRITNRKNEESTLSGYLDDAANLGQVKSNDIMRY